MESRQGYFTLLSPGKQVDGTEDVVLHREPPHHLRAEHECQYAILISRRYKIFDNNAPEMLKYSGV